MNKPNLMWLLLKCVFKLYDNLCPDTNVTKMLSSKLHTNASRNLTKLIDLNYGPTALRQVIQLYQSGFYFRILYHLKYCTEVAGKHSHVLNTTLLGLLLWIHLRSWTDMQRILKISKDSEKFIQSKVQELILSYLTNFS